jgi:hypothetical protein
MSDTPRTDAEAWEVFSSCATEIDVVVEADFARTLERELAAAHAALIGLWRTSRKHAADMDDEEYAAFRVAEELVAKLPPIQGDE